MTTHGTPGTPPLWLSMEGLIRDLPEQDLSTEAKERTIQRLAGDLDMAGHAGNMLMLRIAVEERLSAGRPLLKDFEQAVSALTLDEVENSTVAAARIAVEVGQDFPQLKKLDRREDILQIVERTRLDLHTARARDLGGEAGVRYLIEAGLEVETILSAMEIDRAAHDEIVAKIAAERAERTRVRDLLAKVEDQPEIERVKHLIDNDVADDLIVEIAGVEPAAVDGAKEQMAAEIAEKQRLAEEEAARKAAEAAGPSLDGISDDDMLEYIEGIREIMEFSDVADEIRQMCEQSDIPKCLVDIAVSEPDKLDELESKAGG